MEAELFNVDSLVLSLLSFIVGAVIVFVVRFLRNRPEILDIWDKNEILIRAVGNVIVSIARNVGIITDDEWLDYEMEAQERGVDARLIAALREVEQVLQDYGITVPERLILHLIEAEYGRLKQAGFFDEPG